MGRNDLDGRGGPVIRVRPGRYDALVTHVEEHNLKYGHAMPIRPALSRAIRELGVIIPSYCNGHDAHAALMEAQENQLHSENCDCLLCKPWNERARSRA